MAKRIDHVPRSLIVLAAAAMTLPSPAIAADDDRGGPNNAYLAALKACQVETNDAARLACFDKAAGTILAASEQGDLRMVDREEVRQTRRKLFGFSLPSFGIFDGRDRKDDQPEVELLQTTIAKVRASEYGGWTVVTAEGAVWQIDNPPARLMSPKVGQSLEIKAGALSSYFLRINGQPGVKGKRVA